MRGTYAILTKSGHWYIVEKVRGEVYGSPYEGKTVWSALYTTALICEVGEEDRRVALVEFTGEET